MTIKAVIENLWKMKKFYQMNTEEENDVIVDAVCYLEMWPAVRGFVEALKKFENSDDYIRAIDNVLEIIDNALGEAEE